MIFDDRAGTAGHYEDVVPAATERESFGVWSANAGDEPEGGDWCAIVPLSAYTVALTIGDVAGHGVAAAAFRARMRASILAALSETEVPSDVLSAANAVAYGEGFPTIVTAIVAVFDRRYRTLTFANSGHPAPLLCARDGQAFLEHRPADLPLGIFPEHAAANYVIALPRDALVVLYTDGITEHERNPIQGEQELVVATRDVFGRPELEAAAAIADRVLRLARGDDDAATMALRLR